LTSRILLNYKILTEVDLFFIAELVLHYSHSKAILSLYIACRARLTSRWCAGIRWIANFVSHHSLRLVQNRGTDRASLRRNNTSMIVFSELNCWVSARCYWCILFNILDLEEYINSSERSLNSWMSTRCYWYILPDLKC